MRGIAISVLLAGALCAGCATPGKPSAEGTLAELRDLPPDVEEADVEQGLDQAMLHYRRFLEEAPETEMTPDAMRRLADLQIEKRFGIHTGDRGERGLAAPTPAPLAANGSAARPAPFYASAEPGVLETEREFELRTTAGAAALFTGETAYGWTAAEPGAGTEISGPLEAIELYDRLLDEYPDYGDRDKVLYQMARAYDELGRSDEAIATMERLIRVSPGSPHFDEVQFRRGEYFFTRRRYLDAENAYGSILGRGESSFYYEMALYKLGWTFYKQELYQEALHGYFDLLDHKVSLGYDFDASHEEEDERRVADTFRVISLSFNNLGGPEEVPRYFSSFGNRAYEDRIYWNLGEHYLAKLRYDDAAKAFRSFVSLYPFHRAAPRFSVRIIDTFTKGGFPKLVLASKREFASMYGLQAEYWQHHSPGDSPEVLAHLEANLKDLATHYHAEYQELDDPQEKAASYREALSWYGEYLDSFPDGSESPAIHYRLADLLLENEDFMRAAEEYERTAYNYPPHSQAAAAGYAAVYSYRQQLERGDDGQGRDVMRAAVASSLRFADAFPDHEQAAAVLAAAAGDLYEMKDFAPAVDSAQRVVDSYASAAGDIRRSAWLVVAHGSFELSDYPRAESAYAEVLAVTPEDDPSHGDLVDNLAASIYRQGELAGEAGEHLAAADHFLRIRSAAPTSTLRATAEYDAGAALIRAESWERAASVLDEFRGTFPEHELNLEATRQIAFAHRESGRLALAADEYFRISVDSADPAMRSEALLVAGELYEQTGIRDRALEAYTTYVTDFPDPVEVALETRFKIATMHDEAGDEPLYLEQLERIVRIDADAGSQRTARTRTLAGRSALVLAQRLYREFAALRLSQPFEESLQSKQEMMDETIDAMSRLVDYKIADVTSAATFYMAETYLDFSRSLISSERPPELDPADLLDYELALEEEAFPFEEKAIGLHEENIELLQAGVFNDWTEKSLLQLAGLVPGRYAKSELRSPLPGSVDRYVYRPPLEWLPTAPDDIATRKAADGPALPVVEGDQSDATP
jgi:tetratricopeptide (TPR) repeat protein